MAVRSQGSCGSLILIMYYFYAWSPSNICCEVSVMLRECFIAIFVKESTYVSPLCCIFQTFPPGCESWAWSRLWKGKDQWPRSQRSRTEEQGSDSSWVRGWSDSVLPQSTQERLQEQVCQPLLSLYSYF